MQYLKERIQSCNYVRTNPNCKVQEVQFRDSKSCVISNDTMYPTSPHIFSLVFWGSDGMLSIAITRDLKENMKSLLVICTEHETWSNGKQKLNQITFW